MTKVIISIAALVASSSAALAVGDPFATVPEIDAAAGVAAVAALGGAVAVLRERFKR